MFRVSSRAWIADLLVESHVKSTDVVELGSVDTTEHNRKGLRNDITCFKSEATELSHPKIFSKHPRPAHNCIHNGSVQVAWTVSPCFETTANKHCSMTMTPDTDLCLQQGCQCKCNQCQIWTDRWDKELDAFLAFDTMMHKRKTLFQTCKRLRAQHPDMLWLHHSAI